MSFGSDTFFWLWGVLPKNLVFLLSGHFGGFRARAGFIRSTLTTRMKISEVLVAPTVVKNWLGEMGMLCFILHLPCADECSCVYMYWVQYIIIVLHRYRCVLGHIMFCSISIVLLASLRFKMNYFIISIFTWLVFAENNKSDISATCAWFPTILLWGFLIVEVTFGEWCSPIAMWTMKFHNISFLLACL